MADESSEAIQPGKLSVETFLWEETFDWDDEVARIKKESEENQKDEQ